MEHRDEKREMQNKISLCILLTGLLVGSLFVDVVQLFMKSGFSRQVVQKNDVLETNGKTWVAYTDPRVDLTVLTDSSCTDCDAREALTWIRRIMPTTVARTVEYTSYEGQQLAINHPVTALPAFLFSSSIKKTGFYLEASGLFTEGGDWYELDMTKIGETPGKFLKLPEVNEDDITIGGAGAPITMIEYVDFQCPYSKLFHTAIQKAVKEYPNDIRFVSKQFPLSFHPQARSAALATECANEQGKFPVYSDMLFAKQDEWGKSVGTGFFKGYARTLRLNTFQFNTCLDTGKYAGKVQSDTDEAKRFGISGTPGTFINDQFVNGAVSYDELKSIIDENLAK